MAGENTRSLVRLALQFLQEHTCVSFQEDGPWLPMVRIFKGQGCYSEVGRDIFNREQRVSIGTGCELVGTVGKNQQKIKINLELRNVWN